MKDWNLFNVNEKEVANVWDGHTPKDVAERLRKFLTPKTRYPQSYEECCKIMQVARPIIWFDYYDVSSISEEGDEYEHHIENTLCAFRKLLICRDAYWKLYGQENGLVKPWEPSKDKMVYSFYRHSNEIETAIFSGESVTFEFPTAEMRDDFKKNFDPDIEICKELL